MPYFLKITGDNASISEPMSRVDAFCAKALYQKEVKEKGYKYEGSTGNYVKPVADEDYETWTSAEVVDEEGKGEDRTCTQCGKTCPPSKYEFTTGYGRDKDGGIVCYECCAKWDIEQMTTTGKHCLYLTKRADGYYVSNWPASVEIKCYYGKKGDHNIARCRYDVWFHGPDGYVWHGVQFGDNTQVCHVKRTKQVSQAKAA